MAPGFLQVAVFVLIYFFCQKEAHCLDEVLRLRSDLLAKYQRSVRPVRDYKDGITVYLNVALRQITDLDEKNQVLKTFCWLRVYWKDEYLAWNKTEYGEISSIMFPSRDIWIPDIYLYNNVDEQSDGGLQPGTNVKVTSEGEVSWLTPSSFTSSCKIDIGPFPYDDQHCILHFGSWTHTGVQVDLQNASDAADLSDFADNGEWWLMGMPVRREEKFYSCCPEPYPNLKFSINLRRRPMFYFFNLVLPCLILLLINPLVFYLPPDSGERMGFCMTILLALVVFLQLVSESLPKTSDNIPLIGKFFAGTIFLLGLTAMANIIILHLYYQRPGSKAVHPVIRKIFLVYLAKIFCVTNSSEQDDDEKDGNDSPDTLKISNPFVDLTQTFPFGGSAPNSPDPGSRDYGTWDCSGRVRRREPPRVTFNLEAMQTNSLIYLKEILRAVNVIVKDIKEQRADEHVELEWRDVAMIMDRVALFFVIVATVALSMAILLFSGL
ncbi:neuronal acetylcholine receptor subunit alpha-10-like [Branchiostoma floridae]|uniref:Neuronal acetylcholine receptor subunit alpha-10-like n=1 Tax=Branchiostoma floridae TaxID=7739 RepID=A0A9J7MAM7_BRAFL|nr:neuronal acetylcholine receptor subunit alpha-10-like [Branchiostoma floridae]